MVKKKEFIVEVGDASYYFEMGRSYSDKQLEVIFRRRLLNRLFGNDPDLFPGVRFRDDAGNTMKPIIQVVLIPVKPEN